MFELETFSRTTSNYRFDLATEVFMAHSLSHFASLMSSVDGISPVSLLNAITVAKRVASEICQASAINEATFKLVCIKMLISKWLQYCNSVDH